MPATSDQCPKLMNGTRELANLNVSLQNNVHIAEAIQVCFKIGYIPSCADFFSILPMKIDQKTGVLLSSNIAMENDPDPQIAHLTGETSPWLCPGLPDFLAHVSDTQIIGQKITP